MSANLWWKIPPTVFDLAEYTGAVAKLQDIMLLTNSPRGAAAKPGQGRERMGGQFAGYIPANRAERFRRSLVGDERQGPGV